MRRWPQLVLVLVVLAYGVTILVSALAIQRADFLTLPDTGAMTFEDEPISGLPDGPVAGVLYEVRLLLPPASEESRLDFSALDADGSLLEPVVQLCPPDVEVPDGSVCLTEVWDSGVAYGSEVPVELPAFIRFPASFEGRVVRLQYTVTDPDVVWNPLDSPPTRLFVLGTFTVAPAGSASGP